MIALFSAALLVALAANVPTADVVAECRAHRDAFDVDATIASCGAAADDARLDVASRIFALRLLAGAHVLKKDEHAAEMVLVRMLAFDADAAPAADDGPELRRLLERARVKILDDDALDVRVVRDADERATAVRVADRHGRVARAELVIDEARTPLARLDEAPGVFTFAFPVDVIDDASDEESDAHVVVVGWTQKVLREARVAAPRAPLAVASVAQMPPDALHTLGWVLVGTGATVAAAGAVFWSATSWDLGNREACAADPENGCIPNEPLLFGLYAVEDRADFFAHQTAWVFGSTAAMGAGALIALAGVGLVLHE